MPGMSRVSIGRARISVTGTLPLISIGNLFTMRMYGKPIFLRLLGYCLTRCKCNHNYYN